jgi:hypothetical protein
MSTGRTTSPLFGMTHEIEPCLKLFDAASEFVRVPPVVGIKKSNVCGTGSKNTEVSRSSDDSTI